MEHARSGHPPLDVTSTLERLSRGENRVVDDLFPVIYEDLHRLAGIYLRRERDDHTLQATALVHEAYLRLVDLSRAGARSRAQFFSIAARAMRRILIDHARGHQRQKRRGAHPHLVLDESICVSADLPRTDLLALDEALTELARRHPDDARIVEMRFFAGLTEAEIADVIGVGERTVQRRWRYAQVWLYRRLAGDASRVE